MTRPVTHWATVTKLVTLEDESWVTAFRTHTAWEVFTVTKQKTVTLDTVHIATAVSGTRTVTRQVTADSTYATNAFTVSIPYATDVVTQWNTVTATRTATVEVVPDP